MDDISRKIKKIDEKDIDNDCIAFLDRIIEDYKVFDDMLKSVTTNTRNNSFSNDSDKFVSDCVSLIEYIKSCIENEKFSILYMIRQGNVIEYGQKNHGVKIDKYIINMISDNNLILIYKLLQREFSSQFCDGYKHTFGIGYSLNPTIGDNVVIDVDSDNVNDRNWFYEESHKEQKSKMSKK